MPKTNEDFWQEHPDLLVSLLEQMASQSPEWKAGGGGTVTGENRFETIHSGYPSLPLDQIPPDLVNQLTAPPPQQQPQSYQPISNNTGSSRISVRQRGKAEGGEVTKGQRVTYKT